MSESTISCPRCGAEIELTEALTGRIEAAVRAKYEAEAAEKDREVAAKLSLVKEQWKELEKAKEAVDEQVAERLREERRGIAEQERKKILAEEAEVKGALEEELEEKRKQLSEAKKKELDLLKQQREIEEKAEGIELEVEKKLAEARKKIAEEAGEKAAQEQMLKLREKEDIINTLKDQLESARRRAELGSQEAQGEALEGELQEVLERTFPYDSFEEVKKGQRGADIVQVVYSNAGKVVGKILWESKYTKMFQRTWTEKLKKDQQGAGADIAVLMTMTLPKEVKSFGLLDDVWVTDFDSMLGLATALRMSLINIARERGLSANRETLKDMIYQYVTGNEFAMQIKAIVEAFSRMKEDLDKERRAMERIWKSREKQIESVVTNVVGIHGSLEGFLGSKALPGIEGTGLEEIGE